MLGLKVGASEAEPFWTEFLRSLNRHGLHGKFPRLGALVDEAENGVPAFMAFPSAHWTQTCSTNPLETIERRNQAANERRGHLPQ